MKTSSSEQLHVAIAIVLAPAAKQRSCETVKEVEAIKATLHSLTSITYPAITYDQVPPSSLFFVRKNKNILL